MSFFRPSNRAPSFIERIRDPSETRKALSSLYKDLKRNGRSSTIFQNYTSRSPELIELFSLLSDNIDSNPLLSVFSLKCIAYCVKYTSTSTGQKAIITNIKRAYPFISKLFNNTEHIQNAGAVFELITCVPEGPIIYDLIGILKKINMLHLDVYKFSGKPTSRRAYVECVHRLLSLRIGNFFIKYSFFLPFLKGIKFDNQGFEESYAIFESIIDHIKNTDVPANQLIFIDSEFFLALIAFKRHDVLVEKCNILISELIGIAKLPLYATYTEQIPSVVSSLSAEQKLHVFKTHKHLLLPFIEQYRYTDKVTDNSPEIVQRLDFLTSILLLVKRQRITLLKEQCAFLNLPFLSQCLKNKEYFKFVIVLLDVFFDVYSGIISDVLNCSIFKIVKKNVVSGTVTPNEHPFLFTFLQKAFRIYPSIVHYFDNVKVFFEVDDDIFTNSVYLDFLISLLSAYGKAVLDHTTISVLIQRVTRLYETDGFVLSDPFFNVMKLMNTVTALNIPQIILVAPIMFMLTVNPSFRNELFGALPVMYDLIFTTTNAFVLDECVVFISKYLSASFVEKIQTFFNTPSETISAQYQAMQYGYLPYLYCLFLQLGRETEETELDRRQRKPILRDISKCLTAIKKAKKDSVSNCFMRNFAPSLAEMFLSFYSKYSRQFFLGRLGSFNTLFYHYDQCTVLKHCALLGDEIDPELWLAHPRALELLIDDMEKVTVFDVSEIASLCLTMPAFWSEECIRYLVPRASTIPFNFHPYTEENKPLFVGFMDQYDHDTRKLALSSLLMHFDWEFDELNFDEIFSQPPTNDYTKLDMFTHYIFETLVSIDGIRIAIKKLVGLPVFFAEFTVDTIIKVLRKIENDSVPLKRMDISIDLEPAFLVELCRIAESKPTHVVNFFVENEMYEEIFAVLQFEPELFTKLGELPIGELSLSLDHMRKSSVAPFLFNTGAESGFEPCNKDFSVAVDIPELLLNPVLTKNNVHKTINALPALDMFMNGKKLDLLNVDKHIFDTTTIVNYELFVLNFAYLANLYGLPENIEDQLVTIVLPLAIIGLSSGKMFVRRACGYIVGATVQYLKQESVKMPRKHRVTKVIRAAQQLMDNNHQLCLFDASFLAESVFVVSAQAHSCKMFVEKTLESCEKTLQSKKYSFITKMLFAYDTLDTKGKDQRQFILSISNALDEHSIQSVGLLDFYIGCLDAHERIDHRLLRNVFRNIYLLLVNDRTSDLIEKYSFHLVLRQLNRDHPLLSLMSDSTKNRFFNRTRNDIVVANFEGLSCSADYLVEAAEYDINIHNAIKIAKNGVMDAKSYAFYSDLLNHS
ncbi:hypothetical protein PCE1_000971 [Barthelona sp. PCE]